MATTNRYWYIKRGNIGIVEDYSGSAPTINGVVPSFQNVQTTGLSIRYDAIVKNPHFNTTDIPRSNNKWKFEAANHYEQKPLFKTQFHEAIVYKALQLACEMSSDFNVEKAQYFKQKYEEIVKKAKGFARRYYNGGTYRIKPIDF